MNISEKIISLRKKNGWSQEELAQKVGVSRQSVSKWESDQSMPDLDKAMLLARTFEVSCDYLLGTNEVPSKTELNQEVYLSEADANKYLSISKKMARLIPAGVTLCILSPIPLLVLAYFANAHKHGVTDNLAGGIGVTILLAMVCCAVGLFVYVHYLNAPYEYL